MTPIIAITGPDGSGKSTLINKLQANIADVAVVSIWDLLTDPATAGMLPFRHPKEVDAYLERLEPLARAYFLFHCYQAALDLAYKKEAALIIADGYWFKYFATEVAHGAAWEQLVPLVEPFPKPDLTILLTLAAREAGNRKAKYSGYECGFATERNAESFLSFQAKANKALDKLMSTLEVTKIDASKTPAEVLEGVSKLLATKGFNDQPKKQTKIVSILGIDGSGKGGLFRQLRQQSAQEGTSFKVMTCPEYHEVPDVPHRDLSIALKNLNELGDDTGDYDLKVLALYLQMSLFGPVQNHLLASHDSQYLYTERHSIIDALVYGSFYKQMIKGPMTDGKFANLIAPALSSIDAKAVGLINDWVTTENKRLQRTTPIEGLAFEMAKLMDLPPQELIPALGQQFRTGLPDVVILLDIDPATAIARLEKRAGVKELHEELNVLQQLQGAYQQIIDLLNQLVPTIKTVTIPVDNSMDEAALCEAVFVALNA